MHRILTVFLLSASLAAGLASAQDKTAVPDGARAAAAPMSDKERLDALIRQNQQLMDENARLNAVPKTPEQAFASCMQAAHGAGAMAAESIGSNCKRLLRTDCK